MTGFYFRIQTDFGDWANMDIGQMSDPQLEQLRESMRPELWPGIAIGLAKWIRKRLEDEASPARARITLTLPCIGCRRPIRCEGTIAQICYEDGSGGSGDAGTLCPVCLDRVIGELGEVPDTEA